MDTYIVNKHGVVHSIPESGLAAAIARGAREITKKDYQAALKNKSRLVEKKAAPSGDGGSSNEGSSNESGQQS